MDFDFYVDPLHIENVAEIIVHARKSYSSEKLAVEKYCAEHGLPCMPDVFCMAMGIVERKKIACLYEIDDSLTFCVLNGNIST